MKCICLETSLKRGLKALKEKKTARECLEIAFEVDLKPMGYPYSAEALRHTRKNLLGINQGEASDLLGVSWQTFQCYEQGKFKMPLHRWRQWLEFVEKGGKKLGKIIKKKRARV